MAQFIFAVSRTLQFEGGYSNRSTDGGGETYKGISRVYNPDWSGWKWIDEAKKNPEFPKCLETDSALQDSVIHFYCANYWRPVHGDAIANQDIANEIFDTAVLNGINMALMIAQGALIILGSEVTLDGIMGPQTIAALNAFEPPARLLKCQNGLQFMLLVLGSKEVGTIIEIIRGREEQWKEYILGWLARV